MSEKLFYLDSEIFEFTATVVSCTESDGCFAVTLDKTAFFYEGGGQPSDIGTLGNANVLSVKEADGEIIHYTDLKLAVGSTVTGKIDAKRRFGFMQNHSGEHIVSGTVNRLFGFDNVGFHLNTTCATLDFNGELSEADIRETERLANEAVFKNIPVKTEFPSADELKKINYRSKKELNGDVRIVSIDGVDVCACCAPHVKTTGQIGIIKLLDFERMRSGTRVTIKCGNYALCDYQNKFKNIKTISDILSCKQDEAALAVKNQDEKLTAERQKNTALKRRMTDYIISAAKGDKRLFFEDGFDIKELQLLADGLHKTYGGLKAVMSENDGQFNFVMCDTEGALTAFFNEFKQHFSVRGGGRNGMVQGSVTATKEEIKEFFKD